MGRGLILVAIGLIPMAGLAAYFHADTLKDIIEYAVTGLAGLYVIGRSLERALRGDQK